MMSTKKRLVVPKFTTEAEEADWWDQHREVVSREFVEAGRRGELKILTKEKLLERLATRPVTIRLNEADIELAQKQAKRKGMPYQTYIKSLLHETLAEREPRRR
jgi:predicted DNA binding CopG/RHH family protein